MFKQKLNLVFSSTLEILFHLYSSNENSRHLSLIEIILQVFPEPGSSFLPRHLAPSGAWDTVSTYTLSEMVSCTKKQANYKTNKQTKEKQKKKPKSQQPNDEDA